MKRDMIDAADGEDHSYPAKNVNSGVGGEEAGNSTDGDVLAQRMQTVISPALSTTSEHLVPVSGQSVSSFLRKYGEGIDTARVVGSNRIAQIWADSQEPFRKVLKNRWEMTIGDYRRRISKSTRGAAARQKQLGNSLSAQQANWRSSEASLQQAVVQAQDVLDTTKSRADASHYPDDAIRQAQDNHEKAKERLRVVQHNLSVFQEGPFPETLNLSIGLIHGPKANTSRLSDDIVDIDYTKYVDADDYESSMNDTPAHFLRHEIRRVPWFWDHQAGASLETLENELQEDEHATFGLLLENGENVGFIYYGSATDSKTGEVIPNTLELKYFGLYKDTQGKKYGQIFLDIAVQDMFQRTGIENITLLQSHTNPKNVGRFYFHFGFSLNSIEETASFIPLWATTLLQDSSDSQINLDVGHDWVDPVI